MVETVVSQFDINNAIGCKTGMLHLLDRTNHRIQDGPVPPIAIDKDAPASPDPPIPLQKNPLYCAKAVMAPIDGNDDGPPNGISKLAVAANDQQQEYSAVPSTVSAVRVDPSESGLAPAQMYDTLYQVKRGRGRPKGSKSKIKTTTNTSNTTNGTPAASNENEWVASLKDSLPYVPPHADYTVAREAYETTYVVPAAGKRRKRTREPKSTIKGIKQRNSKENIKSRPMAGPGSKVEAISEWKLEIGDQKDRWAVINSEISNQREPQWTRQTSIEGLKAIENATNGVVGPPVKRGRKRKAKKPPKVDKNGDDLSNSFVQDVMYDTRFWTYDDSPYGFLDQLVSRQQIYEDCPSNQQQSYAQSENKNLQQLPDPPITFHRKKSRIGPMYQARVCRHKDDYHDKRNGDYLPQ